LHKRAIGTATAALKQLFRSDDSGNRRAFYFGVPPFCRQLSRLVFLDVRIEGKQTPVTVKLSYEQASDLAVLLEPFRKPSLDYAAARNSEG
jgi:hypothetical protein